MEVGESVQGECGYCGERVGENKELWLPLECSTCHQFFHFRCLKVGVASQGFLDTIKRDVGSTTNCTPRRSSVAVHVRSLPPAQQGDLHKTLLAVVGVALPECSCKGFPLQGARDSPGAVPPDGDTGG